MHERRREFLRVGAAKLAGLACAAVAVTAAMASPSYAASDKPIGLPGPATPDDGRLSCSYCSKGLECPLHLV